MKLATYQDGSRDGQLVVVSRDLTQAHYASGIANTLQEVLDDWTFMAPQLQDLYDNLNQGRVRYAFAFDAQQCMAPLPRPHVAVQAWAYPEHAARLATLYPGLSRLSGTVVHTASGASVGACADIALTPDLDFGAQWTAVTHDIALGADTQDSLEGIALLMLSNSMRSHAHFAKELEQGLGFLRSHPAIAYSPVAITPDELGPAWEQGRANLTLQTSLNGRKLGLCEMGSGMQTDFGKLIRYLTKTQRLRAGTLIHSGVVSHSDARQGYACLVEKRATEHSQDGQATTPWLQDGDVLRIEVKGNHWGAIEQKVVSSARQTAVAPQAQTAAVES